MSRLAASLQPHGASTWPDLSKDHARLNHGFHQIQKDQKFLSFTERMRDTTSSSLQRWRIRMPRLILLIRRVIGLLLPLWMESWLRRGIAPARQLRRCDLTSKSSLLSMTQAL